MKSIDLPGAVVTSALDKIDRPLPVIFQPASEGTDVLSWCKENREGILDVVHDFGAILLRDFNVENSSVFEKVASVLSDNLLDYSERSSPRKHVHGSIYTSTEHPQDQEIVLHNEQSYNLNFATKLFFYCSKPASSGGNTPLADTRKVLRRVEALDPKQHKLLEMGYKINRHFKQGIGLQWETVFQTSSREEVEKYCTENSIEYEWGAKNTLFTSQYRKCVASHPTTKTKCWFNHCMIFNIHSLRKEIRDVLVSSYPEKELPNNTYFHDGQTINADTIEAINDCYEQEKKEFDWKKNDVLVIDNMLTSHGRTSYSGDREVLVIMSDLCNWNAVS